MKKIISIIMSLAAVFCLASCKNDTDKTSDTTKVSETKSVIVTETEEEKPSSTSHSSNVKLVDMTLDVVESNILYAWGQDPYNEFLMKGDSSSKNKDIGILGYAYLEFGEIDEDDAKKVTYAFKTEIFIIELDVDSELYNSLSVGKDLRFYLDGGGSETFQITAINGQYVLGIRVSEQKDGEKVTETQPEFTLGNLQKVYDCFTGLE